MSFYWPLEAFEKSNLVNVNIYDSLERVHHLSWWKARKLSKAIAAAVAQKRAESKPT